MKVRGGDIEDSKFRYGEQEHGQVRRFWFLS